MKFQYFPLFYFILGTLWLAAALLMAWEHPAEPGSVPWAPILFGIASACSYAAGICSLVKNRRDRRDQK